MHTTNNNNMDLKHQFPNLYEKCKNYKQQNIVHKHNGITYDRSKVECISSQDLEMFIDFQEKYPNVINQCFQELIKILNINEEMLKNKNEKNKKNAICINQAMNNIYNILCENYATLTECTDKINLEIIDDWVLFIKSQDDFCLFF